MHLPIYSLLTS